MKSKYKAVIKVRKQQLDRAEGQLGAAQQRQRESEAAYGLSVRALQDLGDLPRSGSVADLRSNLQMKRVGAEALARAREKVELSKKEVSHYQFLYKKAYLDYEKMKFLESEELKAWQKERQKSENKFLDELATIRAFKGEDDA
ncbi:flagellar export protein FliJ [Campylobacter sp.]|uniref:flagellar export protein FliJ n=1 Tax=Campylobacter sp. TaxID=205 RepID=UPI0026DD6E3B|nr:flagellar export protein FliJ [Campylobacter sp.]MDO4674270.1 flagellar export protein FliJ [Campylobacter sp.]